MLDRDLRMVHQTKLSIETLMEFIRKIAHFNWNSYSYAQVKADLGLSPVTQKSILYALESIFLIRRIPIYGGKKGEIILLEDQFEERTLSNESLEPDFEYASLLYRNIRAQFQYRLGETIAFSSYWTRNDARVPLVAKSKNSTLGLIALKSQTPSLSQVRAAESLLKNENNSKVVFLSLEAKKIEVLNSRLCVLPLAMTL
jgi:predicted AAA+ superfamily ATPase